MRAPPIYPSWPACCRAELSGRRRALPLPPGLQGFHGGALDPGLEHRGVIHVWERLVGHLDPEELAERLPAVLRLPHQQLLGRYRVPDLLVPALRGRHHRLRLAVRAGEGAASLLEHVDHQVHPTLPGRVDVVARLGQVVHQRVAEVDLADGVLHAAGPAPVIPPAQEHLGVGVDLDQLAPMEGRRPVDGGRGITPDLLPWRLAVIGAPPEPNPLLEVGHHVAHVVAGTEAQLLEGELLGRGRRAGETRADQLHPISLSLDARSYEPNPSKEERLDRPRDHRDVGLRRQQGLLRAGPRSPGNDRGDGLPTDNGAPGIREQYHRGYYGAFVLDPDGNNIEAVTHRPE